MGFSRQEYWSELPFPFSGDLPNPGSSQRRNQTQVSPIAGRLFGSSHQEADRILASRILRQSRGSATMQDLWPTERPIGNLPGGSDGQESACHAGDVGPQTVMENLTWPSDWAWLRHLRLKSQTTLCGWEGAGVWAHCGPSFPVHSALWGQRPQLSHPESSRVHLCGRLLCDGLMAAASFVS